MDKARDVKFLTKLQMAILGEVACGLSNQLIADKLGYSERTVRSQVSYMLSELYMENRTQLAIWALQIGMVALDNIHIPYKVMEVDDA